MYTDSRTSEYVIGLTSKEPNHVGQNLNYSSWTQNWTSTILAWNSELNLNYSSMELRTEPQLF